MGMNRSRGLWENQVPCLAWGQIHFGIGNSCCFPCLDRQEPKVFCPWVVRMGGVEEVLVHHLRGFEPERDWRAP